MREYGVTKGPLIPKSLSDLITPVSRVSEHQKLELLIISQPRPNEVGKFASFAP
jgi:hypothetical protein